MNDRVEVVLEFDALAEAVGAHEDAALMSGQAEDTSLALGGRKQSRDRLDGHLLGQGAAQLLGQVLGGGNESTEDDRVEAVVSARRSCRPANPRTAGWAPTSSTIRRTFGFGSLRPVSGGHRTWPLVRSARERREVRTANSLPRGGVASRAMLHSCATRPLIGASCAASR